MLNRETSMTGQDSDSSYRSQSLLCLTSKSQSICPSRKSISSDPLFPRNFDPFVADVSIESDTTGGTVYSSRPNPYSPFVLATPDQQIAKSPVHLLNLISKRKLLDCIVTPLYEQKLNPDTICWVKDWRKGISFLIAAQDVVEWFEIMETETQSSGIYDEIDNDFSAAPSHNLLDSTAKEPIMIIPHKCYLARILLATAIVTAFVSLILISTILLKIDTSPSSEYLNISFVNVSLVKVSEPIYLSVNRTRNIRASPFIYLSINPFIEEVMLSFLDTGNSEKTFCTTRLKTNDFAIQNITCVSTSKVCHSSASPAFCRGYSMGYSNLHISNCLCGHGPLTDGVDRYFGTVITVNHTEQAFIRGAIPCGLWPVSNTDKNDTTIWFGGRYGEDISPDSLDLRFSKYPISGRSMITVTHEQCNGNENCSFLASYINKNSILGVLFSIGDTYVLCEYYLPDHQNTVLRKGPCFTLDFAKKADDVAFRLSMWGEYWLLVCFNGTISHYHTMSVVVYDRQGRLKARSEHILYERINDLNLAGYTGYQWFDDNLSGGDLNENMLYLIFQKRQSGNSDLRAIVVSFKIDFS